MFVFKDAIFFEFSFGRRFQHLASILLHLPIKSSYLVKNALPLFKENKALILNSDIFWQQDNFQDIQNLINNFNSKQKCKLLLVSKEQAHGVYNDKGDFIIKAGFIKRCKANQKQYYYT